MMFVSVCDKNIFIYEKNLDGTFFHLFYQHYFHSDFPLFSIKSYGTLIIIIIIGFRIKIVSHCSSTLTSPIRLSNMMCEREREIFFLYFTFRCRGDLARYGNIHDSINADGIISLHYLGKEFPIWN